MIDSLAKKKIVVLGGTSGIGFATAKAAVSAGASVVVASSKEQKVNSAVAALGSAAAGYVVDLGDEEQVRGLFERIGELDHMV